MFALGLLLPGGGGLYPPTKNYAPGRGAPPGLKWRFFFLRLCISIDIEVINLQKQNKTKNLHYNKKKKQPNTNHQQKRISACWL
ncbi:hypothetical protein, partial [Enterobacter hormaechei]